MDKITTPINGKDKTHFMNMKNVSGKSFFFLKKREKNYINQIARIKKNMNGWL